ncbi:MAG: YadA-like family protein [Rhizobiaceae bacterium]
MISAVALTARRAFFLQLLVGTAAGSAVLVSPAAAQQSVVSACAGVSLPRSVVTDIIGPVVTGVVQPVEGVVNPVLGVVGALLPGVDPLSIDASGLLSQAASGAPITLSVLNTDGVIAGPSDECIATSDGVTLNQEAGIAIGGNRISGLGQNGQAASASDIDAIALGNGASTASGATAAIAVGKDAAASGAGSVALGAGATATGDNSVALGAGSIANANLGAAAYDPAGNGVAGAAAGEISVGSVGQERRITHVAAGSADTDAANVGQLKALDQKFTDMAGWSLRYDSAAKDVATLEGANGTRIRNVAAGALSATSMDAVNGSQLHATNQALAELSNVAVRYDVDTDGNRTNSVTLQGGDTDAPVRVRHVAAGVDDTDAVNVAQLESGLGEVRTYVDQSINNSYQVSKAYTDEQVGKVRTEARQAAAIGLAASSIRFDNTPGKVSVGASGGFWRGEGAFAVGLGYTSETGKVRANATATTAGGAVGAGAGFSLTLN